MNDRATEFNYKGHQYVLFRSYDGFNSNSYGGVVHNPDCPCQEKGGEEQ